MARRHRGRFVRPAPRTKMWIGQGVGVTAIASNTKVLEATYSAGALLLRPFTILRTRMEIQFRIDQDAADEAPFGSYGQMVVTDTAAAIGVTAVPDPSGINGDPEADWFVWQAMFAHIQAGSLSQAVNEYKWTIDSRAMRKVSIDEDVVSVFSSESSGGSFLTTNGRQLIQLH